nr:F-box-like/WD repeat-containing protein ebi [Drosophila takahashii]
MEIVARKLRGHESDVYVCAWSPTNDTSLASGSGDGSARMWDSSGTFMVTLRHCLIKDGIEVPSHKDVVALDWHPTGNLLATGSHDGHVRIWRTNCILQTTLEPHDTSIFVLKWSKCGNHILTGGGQKTAMVFGCGLAVQRYLGVQEPIRRFTGHTGHVNAVRWCPQGELLSSGGDDRTLKIWNLSSDRCCRTLQGHSGDITALAWSPTGDRTCNSKEKRILASASLDSTVRLWDVDTGSCIRTLNEPRDRIFTVAFSPDGRHLASGSFDQCIYIWSTQTGELIHRYNAPGSIYEVCWNLNGIGKLRKNVSILRN